MAGDQGVTDDVPQRFSNITGYQAGQYEEKESSSAVSVQTKSSHLLMIILQ